MRPAKDEIDGIFLAETDIDISQAVTKEDMARLEKEMYEEIEKAKEF
jgi:hypothetical protein